LNARRGEIWLADLSPTRGSEQSGVRPILIFQNDAINRFTTTALAIPLTTNLRRAALPSCVKVAAGEGGLTANSVALCHQLRAVDATRFIRRLGAIEPRTMLDVERCALFTLGID